MSVDTSRVRVTGYAVWHEIEAAKLRKHHADMGSMPELAEMHEETAATLRALLAEREALIADNARLLDSVTRESEARAAAEAERDAAFLRGWQAGRDAAADQARATAKRMESLGLPVASAGAEVARIDIRALTPPEAGA